MRRPPLKERIYRLQAPIPLLVLLVVNLPWAIVVYNFKSPVEQANWTGISALFFIIVSFTLYLFLLMIQNYSRHRYISHIVIFTRRYIRFHAAAAIVGLGWAIAHVYFVAPTMMVTPKVVSGMAVFITLGIVLFTGYLRQKKASGKRRKFHRYVAFMLIFLMIVHVML